MPQSDNDLISVQGAAKIVGVSVVRLREYIRDGRLPAQMVANSYVLKRGDAKAFKRLPTGRPATKSKAKR